jgi:tripartite-type tricarboxylate transporter receptor subunit TctC
MNESGVKGLNVDSWIGLFAPAGTPKPVIEKLQGEIAAAAPELKAKFVAVGGDYLQVQPDKLKAFVQAEFDKWSKLIKDAGITLE